MTDDSELRRLRAEVSVLRERMPCICPECPDDPPLENCPRHGLIPAEIWAVVTKVEAQRDRYKAEALEEAASAAVSDEYGIPWDYDFDRATVAVWLEERAESLRKNAQP